MITAAFSSAAWVVLSGRFHANEPAPRNSSPPAPDRASEVNVWITSPDLSSMEASTVTLLALIVLLSIKARLSAMGRLKLAPTPIPTDVLSTDVPSVSVLASTLFWDWTVTSLVAVTSPPSIDAWVFDLTRLTPTAAAMLTLESIVVSSSTVPTVSLSPDFHQLIVGDFAGG